MATRRGDLDLVADFLADQGPGQRRADREALFLHVALVLADDLEEDLGPGVVVDQGDGAGGDPLVAVAERVGQDIDRLALPIPAFLPDLEANLAAFGERVIAEFSR